MSHINHLIDLKRRLFELKGEDRYLLQPMYAELSSRQPDVKFHVLSMEIAEAEKARERCILAGMFVARQFVKTRDRMLTLEQCHRLLKPFKYFTVELTINPALLTQTVLNQPRIIEQLGEQIGLRAFDSLGGNYVTVYAACEEVPAGYRLTTFFLGVEHEEESIQDILSQQS